MLACRIIFVFFMGIRHHSVFHNDDFYFLHGEKKITCSSIIETSLLKQYFDSVIICFTG